MDNNLQPFSSCQICFLCQSILQHDEPTKEWKALSCNSCEVTVINPIAESINNAMYGYSISEYRFEQTRLEINNTRIINILRKYKLSGKVLDVGCGYGLFSSQLLKYGDYELDAIEPVNDTVYLQKTKANVYKMSVEEFLNRKSKQRYDIIILNDIIEHLDDPIGMLTKLKGLLQKDGVMLIQTPNYRSVMQYLSKEWSWWMPEDHRFVLSPKSFRILCKKAGLHDIYFTTYEQPYDFFQNISGSIAAMQNRMMRIPARILLSLIGKPIYYFTRGIIGKAGYGGLLLAIVQAED